MSGLLQLASSAPAASGVRRVLVACACVLLRAAPAAIADTAGALPQAMGMLLEALRGGSEGLRRMAASALDAIGGEARLAPALLSGSPPLLQHLLTSSHPPGAAPPPRPSCSLSLCTRWLRRSASAALAAPLDALAALLAHPDARWAAAVSALGLGGGGAATGLDPDAAKELALLLKLCAATYSRSGRRAAPPPPARSSLARPLFSTSSGAQARS